MNPNNDIYYIVLGACREMHEMNFSQLEGFGVRLQSEIAYQRSRGYNDRVNILSRYAEQLSNIVAEKIILEEK